MDSESCVEELVQYWATQHATLWAQGQPGPCVDAALHAVLAGLRRHRGALDLLAWHDQSSRSDAVLARSMLPDAPEVLIDRVCAAARHLRWVELSAAVG